MTLVGITRCALIVGIRARTIKFAFVGGVNTIVSKIALGAIRRVCSQAALCSGGAIGTQNNVRGGAHISSVVPHARVSAVEFCKIRTLRARVRW